MLYIIGCCTSSALPTQLAGILSSCSALTYPWSTLSFLFLFHRHSSHTAVGIFLILCFSKSPDVPRWQCCVLLPAKCSATEVRITPHVITDLACYCNSVVNKSYRSHFLGCIIHEYIISVRNYCVTVMKNSDRNCDITCENILVPCVSTGYTNKGIGKKKVSRSFTLCIYSKYL